MSKETHDRKVRQLANKLKKQGFNVKADLDGFETPDGIGKGDHVADIFATKGKKTKIVEVDTPGTENPDQLATFKRSAAHRKNAEFEHVITKPRK